MIGSEAVEQWKRLAPHRYHDWTRSTWWAMVGGSRFVFHAELKRVEVRVLQHETKSGEFAGSTAQFGCGLPRHNAAKRIIPFDSRPVLPLHAESPQILIASKRKDRSQRGFCRVVTGPELSGQVNLSQWRRRESNPRTEKRNGRHSKDLRKRTIRSQHICSFVTALTVTRCRRARWS